MFDNALLLIEKLPFPMPARQAITWFFQRKTAAAIHDKSRFERFLEREMGERDLRSFLCKTPCKAT
jgi:hypothetical protein